MGASTVIRFQVASLFDGPQVIDVLNYIGQPFREYTDGIKVRAMTEHGHVVFRATELGELSRRVPFDSLVSVQLSSSNAVASKTSSRLQPDRLFGRLDLSPLRKPAATLLSSKIGDNRQLAKDIATLQSWRDALYAHDVQKCPAIYELTLFFSDLKGVSQPDILDAMLCSLDICALPPDSIAAIDIGSQISPIASMIDAASRPPKKFASLGLKFDELHRVMIANLELCRDFIPSLPGAVLRRFNASSSGLCAIIFHDNATMRSVSRDSVRRFLI